MDNVLVTGSSGLVGSAVVRKLNSIGINNIIAPSHKELNLINFNDCYNYFLNNKIEYVIHCAGSVAGIIGNNKDNYGQLYKNAMMAFNVIECSRLFYNNPIKKLLFLGSTCIYPKITEQPIKETSLLTSSLEPTNEGYALAKICGVKMCEYLNKHGYSFISAMPTNVYGINDNYDPIRSHVFPALIRKIHQAKLSNTSVKIGGDGSPIRSFICSDDLADAIIFLMNNYNESETINIGRSEGISILELAKKIADYLEYSGSFEFDSNIPNGTMIKIEDNSKILSLGWTPKINIDDGIKISVEDYLKRFNPL